MSKTACDAHVTVIGYDGDKKHLIIRHPTDSSASSSNSQIKHNLLPLRKRFKRKLRQTCETECESANQKAASVKKNKIKTHKRTRRLSWQQQEEQEGIRRCSPANRRWVKHERQVERKLASSWQVLQRKAISFWMWTMQVNKWPLHHYLQGPSRNWKRGYGNVAGQFKLF